MDHYLERDPRRPQAEPEIIPPDHGDQRSWYADAYCWRANDGYGVHRIYIARPGLPSMLFGLLILGAIVAMVIFVLIGFVLMLPFLIGGIALALIVGGLLRGRRV